MEMAQKMEIDGPVLRNVVREVSLAGRKQLKIMVGLILALSGAGGGWAYSTQNKIDESSDQLRATVMAETIRDETLARHEVELRATADRVESIAILLVQQGRYVEDMVRAVTPKGVTLPPRPPALDEIEREILRRDSRKTRP